MCQFYNKKLSNRDNNITLILLLEILYKIDEIKFIFIILNKIILKLLKLI